MASTNRQKPSTWPNGGLCQWVKVLAIFLTWYRDLTLACLSYHIPAILIFMRWWARDSHRVEQNFVLLLQARKFVVSLWAALWIASIISCIRQVLLYPLKISCPNCLPALVVNKPIRIVLLDLSSLCWERSLVSGHHLFRMLPHEWQIPFIAVCSEMMNGLICRLAFQVCVLRFPEKPRGVQEDYLEFDKDCSPWNRRPKNATIHIKLRIPLVQVLKTHWQ